MYTTIITMLLGASALVLASPSNHPLADPAAREKVPNIRWTSPSTGSMGEFIYRTDKEYVTGQDYSSEKCKTFGKDGGLADYILVPKGFRCDIYAGVECTGAVQVIKAPEVGMVDMVVNTRTKAMSGICGRLSVVG